MTNPFTAHPREQAITYLEHCCFAVGIASRLSTSVVAFAAHAILPFIPIEPRLNLESTASYLTERNQWIDSDMRAVHADVRPDSPAFDPRAGSEILLRSA